MTVRILQGDVRIILSGLEPGSFDCIVTSPPYWGLRDYGVAGQIGLDPTLGDYIDTLAALAVDLWRVPNPVSDMRRTCTAEIERLKLQKMEAEAVLRRARQMAGASTGGIAARVMAGAIDEVLCRKAAEIEAFNMQIAHFKRARDILGEVVYQPPEPPPAEPTATFSGFFIGASS